MSSGSQGDELQTPALGINNLAPIDEVLALNVHLVAKAAVDTVVREAVEDLAQAVASATLWLADAVRGELVSQAVVAAEPPEGNQVKNEEPIELPRLEGPSTRTDRPPSAVIHAVAKATVDAVTSEAVHDIVQAVEKASDWITQAVGSELVSESVDFEEDVAVHNATEWITEAVRIELVAHAVADAVPSNEAPSEPEEFTDTPEVAAAQKAPRFSVQLSASSVADVRALAEATADGAVRTALENVTQAISNASEWLAQAVRGELLAQAVVDASPSDGLQADEAEDNSTDSTSSEEPIQPPLSTEAVDASIHVPALRIPSSVAAVAECHELAVPFINDAVSSGLHQTVPAASPVQDEPQEYAEDPYEDYTPINSPTTEAAPSKSPEKDTSPAPPVILSGRATPPDTMPTPRRMSPITSKRGLGTPTSKETSPSSAPSAIPSPRFVDEATNDCSEPEPSHSTLPPLVLPAAQLTGRTKHQQHKTPRKTPGQSSHRAFSNHEDALGSESPRATTTSSSRLDKHTSRSSLTAEFELTPLSSARAAALIYAQQPSSSRHRHHHHKPKKLRDTASQTSPPPSPSLTGLPREPLVGCHDGSELPKTQSAKHSPRDLSIPSPEKKVDGGNNILLAPLSKTPAVPASADSSTKTSSPSRTHRKHGHGHSHTGTGGGPSPTKRTGYCQRCVFEGRTCKINDCLKHQVLK